MGLVPSRGGSKKFYTRKDDEVIIAMSAEKKSATEIGKAVGHSEASVNYRISRVLNGTDKDGKAIDSLDQIKYKKA